MNSKYASQYKYEKEHLKRIPLNVQKPEYTLIKERADRLGIGVNTWIKVAIKVLMAIEDTYDENERRKNNGK